jgi:hypothetical protein
VSCLSATQCPGVDDECSARSCTAGACAVDLAPAGTVCGGTGTCDGAGHCKPHVDVVINEVESSTSPTGSPDWVELYNRGADTADLSGYIFKDNDDSHAAVLPANTSLAPGAYLVLEELTAFPFGLGSADSARLFKPDASVPGGLTLVDTYSWTAHASTTYARCPDGAPTFGTSTTTNGTKGTTNSCQ